MSLAPPADGAERRPWSVRRVDLDPFRHVNNAVQWAVIEEMIGADDAGRRGRAETEFHVPVDLGTPVEIAIAGSAAWLVSGERVLSSFRWAAAA